MIAIAEIELAGQAFPLRTICRLSSRCIELAGSASVRGRAGFLLCVDHRLPGGPRSPE